MISKRTQENDLEHELKQHILGDVRFDSFSKILYSTDASIYQMEPIGVVLPRNKNDVLAVVDIARRNNVPIMPRGGGTSLAGQTVNHAIVLDFSKYMNSVIEVNQHEKWARVEPGVVVDHLNDNLAEFGLQYAPDPSTTSRATIGGGIGNNSCGAHSVIYGKTGDQIIEVSAILTDASEARFSELSDAQLHYKLKGDNLESDIYRQIAHISKENWSEIDVKFPKIARRVSGYNLDQFLGNKPTNMAQMIVGSEGTLAVVTEAKVKLVPRPTLTAVSVLHFSDIIEACEATLTVLQHNPSAVELIGSMLLERTRASVAFSRLMNFIEGNPGAVLAVEFYGDSVQELEYKIQSLEDSMARRKLGYAHVKLFDKASQTRLWNVRKAGLGILMSIRGDKKPIPFVEDTAVPPEKLAPFVKRFDEIVRSYGTEAGYYGHASEGCLHIRPEVSLKSKEGQQTMLSIAEEIGDLVSEFGGSLSGEHGDGIVRGVWTKKMFGAQIYQAFQDVKTAFDPQGIMNPGKIINCPSMIENLRYGNNYETPPMPTVLDFSADQGFAGAVEMCNGMGDCRKDGGTMCPSYMVTREEEHSTRGRANLLRASLSGKLPSSTLTGNRLHEALDLCLECKGCKGECPSTVDMAKLKYEYLHQYNKANGITRRTWMFANINTLSRWGSRLAPLSNWTNKIPGIRLLMDIALGVDRHRPLPVFTSVSFPEWFKNHIPAGHGEAGRVVLFNDTFMNYNLPQIGKAATYILEKAGFHVTLANSLCCGRPMISKGLLVEAKSKALHNVNSLLEYAEKGIPIVGCEPSCLLTLRDEYPDLLQNDAAKLVASNSYLIDEFLQLLHDQGKLKLEFSNLRKNMLFHGHCHQKALVGTKSSINVLSMPEGYKVEEVNSGCCGMAGSFGFEKEHYDLSMKIAELRLFPAIAKKNDDWEVVVMGVSCRQQVEHGMKLRARHLVEVLKEAVV
ncbi:FAD-binding protein [SAR202 cluster bacterium AD-804-J14_MRT_500m]|nr:FAD-binding protein [SAR202 cluster bacterium AD-804-J14_MRT_500m]